MNASLPSATSSPVVAHWAERYIGKPWLPGGRGPDVFDCWGLLRWISTAEFKRPLLPDYPIPPAAKREVSAMLECAIAGPDWRKLAGPMHGCAVGLSHNLKLHHCGFFVATDGGLVLHAKEGHGVVAESISALRLRGWNRIEFYWNTQW